MKWLGVVVLLSACGTSGARGPFPVDQVGCRTISGGRMLCPFAVCQAPLNGTCPFANTEAAPQYPRVDGPFFPIDGGFGACCYLVANEP
ncbi:MAG: hypothetical protein SFW67_05145 [Myxococcaceae bacterium]|nr:hypothetical protein [Myxococcaceae bacterium]